MPELEETYRKLLYRQRAHLLKSGVLSAVVAVVAWILLICLGLLFSILLFSIAAHLFIYAATSISPMTFTDTGPLAYVGFMLIIPIVLVAISLLETLRYAVSMHLCDRRWTARVGALHLHTPVLPMEPSTSLMHPSASLHVSATPFWAIKELLLAPAHLSVDAFRFLSVKLLLLDINLSRIVALCEHLCSHPEWRPVADFKKDADLIPLLVVLEVVWLRSHHDVWEMRIAQGFAGEIKAAAQALRLAGAPRTIYVKSGNFPIK